MPSVQRKFTKYMVETELASSVLHSATYRQHSARIGRFQIPDRAHGNIFIPQRLNRYSYVRNDPINRWDPKGLDDVAPIDDGGFVPALDGGGGGGGGGSGDSGGDDGGAGFGDGGLGSSDPGPSAPPLGPLPWIPRVAPFSPIPFPDDPTSLPGVSGAWDPFTGDFSGDPSDPSSSAPTCSPDDPTCCDPSDPSCIALLGIGSGGKTACLSRCNWIFAARLLLCTLVPAPGDLDCAALATLNWGFCRAGCYAGGN